MPVTRDENFPDEIAQLMATFNRCSDGHVLPVVCEASAQFFIAVLVNSAKARGVADDKIDAYVDAMLAGVRRGIIANWNRAPQPGDVAVKLN